MPFDQLLAWAGSGGGEIGEEEAMEKIRRRRGRRERGEG